MVTKCLAGFSRNTVLNVETSRGGREEVKEGWLLHCFLLREGISQGDSSHDLITAESGGRWSKSLIPLNIPF